MNTIMKVKDDQIIMYTDGSITITEASGYTRNILKDSHLYAVLADAFKMRKLLQAVHDAEDQDQLHEAEAKVDEYINSLPR